MGRAMREVFGETVADLADHDPRIVMLDADLGSSTKADIFEARHPERYLQMGIAEQNMLGVAAGLASMGLMPFISTFVSFAVVRPLDQVRVLIAQTGLNVKITAGYVGLFTGRAGKTHQIVDDVSIMRAMPGMITISPADDIETGQVLRWAASYQGPVFVRLVRDATQRLFDEGYTFEFGRAVLVREGRDVTIISTGAETPRVVDAAELLAADGVDAHVLHVPTIKPLDVPAIVAAAERTGLVITVEEHSVIGGLGGAVAETLAEHRPTVVRRLGLQDTYTESGPNEALLDKYGLSAERVAEQVRAIIGRKG
jgi:transketolase